MARPTPLTRRVVVAERPERGSLHPDHLSVEGVLRCRICARLLWEHVERLRRRDAQGRA